MKEEEQAFLFGSILDSSADYEGYFISSKGFLPTVVDRIGIY